MNRLTWSAKESAVREAIESFPAVFGLRGFPGERFRIEPRSSFYSDDNGVQLVVQREIKAGDRQVQDYGATVGAFMDFTRDGAAAVKRELVIFDGPATVENWGGKTVRVQREYVPTWKRYAERARELMLTPKLARAFVAVNHGADTTGVCPACAVRLDAYESQRLGHSRTCTKLHAQLEAEGGAL